MNPKERRTLRNIEDLRNEVMPRLRDELLADLDSLMLCDCSATWTGDSIIVTIPYGDQRRYQEHIRGQAVCGDCSHYNKTTLSCEQGWNDETGIPIKPEHPVLCCPDFAHIGNSAQKVTKNVCK